MPNDFQLDCTWEEVQDATDHRNAAVRLYNQNDPDLGNIIMSSLSGSQIYDLVRPRTEVGTIRQNVYAVDPSGRRCLLIGEPQTSTGTVVFAVIDGTTQYVYSISNGGNVVNLTTVDMSEGDATAFVVTFTTTDYVVSADQTYNDVMAAAADGKVVIGRYGTNTYYFTGDPDDNGATFVRPHFNANAQVLQQIILADDESVTISTRLLASNAVLYTRQTLTNEQKAQARANIGAADGASGISTTIKQELLNCFSGVAWADENGQQRYDALEAALSAKVVESISAVFDQGSATIYNIDSLDSLKQYLTVTAIYDDTSTAVIAGYTLSGTLTVGTSTITVSYGGKSTTFTVTVTADPLPSAYKRLEYVERSTTVGLNQAYNSTGFMLNGTDDAVIKMGVMCIQAPSSANGGYFLVCRQTNSNNTVGFGILATQNGASISAFDGQSCALSPHSGAVDIVNQKFDLTVNKTSSSMTVSDGTNTNTVTGTPRVMASNLYVFAMYPYTGSNLVSQVYGRIYYLNIVEGGVEKLNFIPCKRISDNAVGFYDSVSESFKTSAYYTAGPEV